MTLVVTVLLEYALWYDVATSYEYCTVSLAATEYSYDSTIYLYMYEY
jgi:hypothetical protein